MKKIIIASALALAAAYASLPAAAATSEATCVTNWVGGACGMTTNNGSDGSTLLGNVAHCHPGKKGEDCDCDK